MQCSTFDECWKTYVCICKNSQIEIIYERKIRIASLKTIHKMIFRKMKLFVEKENKIEFCFAWLDHSQLNKKIIYSLAYHNRSYDFTHTRMTVHANQALLKFYQIKNPPLNSPVSLTTCSSVWSGTLFQ